MSELIRAGDKLLQIAELKKQEELQLQQQELQRLQRLIDDPIVERIKRALIKSINDACYFPIKLVLEGELYIPETEITNVLSVLTPWLDNKDYQVNSLSGRGDKTNYMVLIVDPK